MAQNIKLGLSEEEAIKLGNILISISRGTEPAKEAIDIAPLLAEKLRLAYELR